MSKHEPIHLKVARLEKENAALKLTSKAKDILIYSTSQGKEFAVTPSAQDEFIRQVVDTHEILTDGKVVSVTRDTPREVLISLKRDSFYLFAEHLEPAKEEQQGTSLTQEQMASMTSTELYAWDAKEKSGQT